MTTYTDCRTAHTGLYKPHTVYLGTCYPVSIVYWNKNNLPFLDMVAIAIDEKENVYEIYKTQTIYGSIGFLAFPKDPEKINGIYPYL